MVTKDILILVKTYPEISKKYTETVCTGGILAETRELIRLYPVRYRYLEGETQFSKYQWISAKIAKSTTDVRPESFNIIENTPATIDGHAGFKILFSYRDKKGSEYKTLYYGFISGNSFYNLRYNAASRHYYDKDLADFKRILFSFKVVKK